jgi:microcystin-dependent protein
MLNLPVPRLLSALGYTPANSASVSGTFPLGNSVVCDQLSFNGTLTDFTLRINGNAFIPAGGSANLIVSLGGVIQRPGTDFIIVESPPGTNTSTIRFTTAPASGTSHFIVALGGQGSLISNQDWNAKGQILVATADNAATQLNVGSNDTVLTADSTTSSGVAWKALPPSVPSGSVVLFYQANAPTGWTKVTTQNNKALRVVSGSGGGTGGTTNFTSVFTSRTPSGSVSGGSVSVSISGNTGSTSLSAAQLPTHTHGLGNHSHGVNDPGHSHTLRIEYDQSTGAGFPKPLPGAGRYPATFTDSWVQARGTGISIQGATGQTGGGSGLSGQGHNHTFSGSGSGSLSGASFSGSAMDFAVQYIDIILCSKN